MTTTDKQARITATTLSPRSLATISRQPVWNTASAVSESDAALVNVVLVLASQDTGTVCSASLLQREE